ncbi:MAG: AI-2E family transporter [Oscillospiraceae bacterium]|nr:AI-2E family transporter [Oscillospiraceae bacterium]
MIKKIKSYFTDSAVKNTITLCAAVRFYLALNNIPTIKAVFSNAVSIISPFIYAFAIAFILNRPMMWFERTLFKDKKKKRILSVAVTFTIAISLISVLMVLVLPQIGLSIAYLVEAMPGFIQSVSQTAVEVMEQIHLNSRLSHQVQEMWNNIGTGIMDFTVSVLPGVVNVSIGIGNAVIKSIMSTIIAIYMLASKDRLKFQIKKFFYAYFSKNFAEETFELGRMSNTIFSDFIIGKMIDSTIIGIIAFIGMLFIYPDYAVLIAIIIGVTNMIPFFGPFIGAIPSIFILLILSPFAAFVFLIFIIVLQQIDGNIIGPKVLGSSLGLSPLWILVGIIVGNGAMGFLGMVIGVPTFAVIYNLVSCNTKKKLEEKDIVADYENYTINPREENQSESEG